MTTRPTTKLRFLEQRRLDDRVGAAPLRPDEQREHAERADHEDPGPGRPAELAALDQRHHEHRRGHREQSDSPQVEAGVAVLAGLVRQVAPRQGEGHDPDRHVDEEDRPPLGAGKVRVDEPPGEDRSGHARETHDGAEGDECLAQLLGRERDLHEGQSLRDHHGAEQALQHPRDDEPARARRETAGE